MRNRKRKLRKKIHYGTTASLTKMYGYELMRRDGATCAYCRRDLRLDSPLCSVDHVVPVAEGGKTILSNLVLACTACNAKKGKKSAEQFKEERQKEFGTPGVGTYKMAEAFAAAGITPEYIASLSQTPDPQSATSSPSAVSPQATHQYQ